MIFQRPTKLTSKNPLILIKGNWNPVKLQLEGKLKPLVSRGCFRPLEDLKEKGK